MRHLWCSSAEMWTNIGIDAVMLKHMLEKVRQLFVQLPIFQLFWGFLSRMDMNIVSS